MACALQASLDDIDVRRLAEASHEGAREMRCAKSDSPAEIHDMDRLRQMLLDERFQPLDPPRRKSAQSDVHVRSALVKEAYLQKQSGSGDVPRSYTLKGRQRRIEDFAKHISFADRASAQRQRCRTTWVAARRRVGNRPVYDPTMQTSGDDPKCGAITLNYFTSCPVVFRRERDDGYFNDWLRRLPASRRHLSRSEWPGPCRRRRDPRYARRSGW
jgi:hypothetical protein